MHLFRIAGAGCRWFTGTWLVAALIGAAGCVPKTSPEEFFQLSPDAARHRAMEMRRFETSDDGELLSASAAVLQDLGFQVEECVRELGFLRASKERGAREYGQEIVRAVVILLTILSRDPLILPVDLHQKITAALVAQPSASDESLYEVRIVFYRVVWKGSGSNEAPGQQKMEMVRDPQIYQRFFAKLAKAVFLEAHTI